MDAPDTIVSDSTLVQPTNPTPVVTPLYHSKLTWFLLGLVLLVLVGGGGIFLGKRLSAPTIVTQTPAPVAKSTSTSVTNLTYINSKYHLSLDYPSNYTYKDQGQNYVQDQVQRGEQISGTNPAILDTILFNSPQDSFTLDVFPTSNNTNVSQIAETGGVCGSQFEGKFLIHGQIGSSGSINYLENRQLSDTSSDIQTTVRICFFSPLKNMIKLSQTSASTNADKSSSFLKQILSTFKFIENSRATTSDQTAVKNLVTNFYQALTNHDGGMLFNLMTPPFLTDEKTNYNWLIGADLGTNPTYRVFLRMKIFNPKITSIQQVDSNTFVVKLTDQFQAYSNAGTVGYGTTQNRNLLSLTIVKLNGNLFVDKFTDQSNSSSSGNAGSLKYNGFGQ